MLRAATKFMATGRTAKEMHAGDAVGTVLFAWPMTSEIASSFGLDVADTGLWVGVKFDDAEVIKAFKDGTLTGFSIGGRRVTDEPVDKEDDDVTEDDVANEEEE